MSNTFCTLISTIESFALSEKENGGQTDHEIAVESAASHLFQSVKISTMDNSAHLHEENEAKLLSTEIFKKQNTLLEDNS